MRLTSGRSRLPCATNTLQEDELLVEAVQREGTRKWAAIASRLGRPNEAVRLRVRTWWYMTRSMPCWRRAGRTVVLQGVPVTGGAHVRERGPAVKHSAGVYFACGGEIWGFVPWAATHAPSSPPIFILPVQWQNVLNPATNKAPFTEWEQAVIVMVGAAALPLL